MSDLKNGFVPCHPFHHHLNPHPLDEKNCAMPPFHHHLNPHPLDEKNMPGGGGWGGYGGGRVAWHNVILSDCSFISMHTKVTLVLKLYANVIITNFFLQQGSTLCTGVRGEGHQRGDLSSFNAVCLAISWLFLTINDRNWPKFLLSPVSTLWKLIWKQQYNKQRWDLLITPNPAKYG